MLTGTSNPQKLYALSRANIVDLVEHAFKELSPRRCPQCDNYIGYEEYLERKDFVRVIRKYLEPERLCPTCHANIDAWRVVFGEEHKC